MERKNFEITKSEDGWMVASTPAVDRDRDRVMPMGADLVDFGKNPVLIFGHNYSEPWSIIGRVAETVVGLDGIRFRPELRQAANDADPMNVVRLLWDEGLLRAASIGFNPLEWKENEFGGKDFTKWSLLEISLVPIPANQEALRMAAKAMSQAAELVISAGTVEAEAEGETEPEAGAAGNAALMVEEEPEAEVETEALLGAIGEFLSGALAHIEELRR